MAIIRKKCWPKYFEAILSGKKKYDLRINDFDIVEGDMLVLEEWDLKTKEYTGRSLQKKVTYVGKFKFDESILPEKEMRKKGIQIMSLE